MITYCLYKTMEKNCVLSTNDKGILCMLLKHRSFTPIILHIHHMWVVWDKIRDIIKTIKLDRYMCHNVSFSVSVLTFCLLSFLKEIFLYYFLCSSQLECTKK